MFLLTTSQFWSISYSDKEVERGRERQRAKEALPETESTGEQEFFAIRIFLVPIDYVAILVDFVEPDRDRERDKELKRHCHRQNAQKIEISLILSISCSY